MTGSHAGVALAIGVFDGVHRGHQHLIEEMVLQSTREGHDTVCLTFDPDPDVVLYPERSARALSTLTERVDRLRATGVGRVDVLPFTWEVARQSALEFVVGLQSTYELHALWAGSDFALGRDRLGTVEALQEIGRARRFEVRPVEPLLEDSRAISSTWIRELLREGHVQRAGILLGRPYTLRGEVVEGARRGGQLGFPTANLVPPTDRALPADGVYVVGVQVGGRSLHGVANLGGRPTFREGDRLLETHVLDFDADLYGADIEVSFLGQLRGVNRFDSVDELRQQIERDVQAARDLLARWQTEAV